MSPRTCNTIGCDLPHRAFNLCRRHYAAAVHTGSLDPRTAGLAALIEQLRPKTPLPDWDDAACLETGPEGFFADDIETRRVAARVCAPCPIRATCREWALSEGITEGVWGGMHMGGISGIHRVDLIAGQEVAA